MDNKNQIITPKMKRGLIIAYIPLFILSGIMLMWLLYYFMFLSSRIGISTAYLDDATYAEEETFFIDINYYTNRNGNGVEVFELKFNYYTDTALPDKKEDGTYDTKYMYSTGIQSIGDVASEFPLGEGLLKGINSIFTGSRYNEVKIQNAYCYATEIGGTSFASLELQKLTDQDYWIYDIGGELCLIQTIENARLSTGNPEYAKFNYQTLWIKDYTIIDTSYFIASIFDSVKTMPEGEKIFSLNLSEYFFVSLQNDDNTFNTTPTDDVNYLYANIRVNIEKDGMIESGQSMFGIVQNDPDWSLYGGEAESYWQVRTDYTIDNDDFTAVFQDGVYYAKIKQSCADYLSAFNYLNIVIDLDLDNFYISSVKVDVEAFDPSIYDYKIYSVKLESRSQRDFTLRRVTSHVDVDDTINLKWEVV